MFYRFRFFRRARALALTPDEKDAARRELLSFMETHPVRPREAARPVEQRSNPLFSFLAPALKPIPLAVLALLLVGTGTASAAEGALPDSPLYFLKVNVNEPIRRSLARSAEAKAEVEADLAARRLDETKALVEQDRLTPSIQADLEARFKEQADRAEAKILILKDTGAADVAADLSARYEAKLQVRKEALDRLSERPVPAGAAITPVLDAVRLKAEAATRQRERLTDDLGSGTRHDKNDAHKTDEKWKEIAFEAQAGLEGRLREVQSERARADAFTSPEVGMKADLQIAAAKEAYAKGHASLRAGAYADAATAFRATREALREVEALLRGADKPKPEHADEESSKEVPKKEDRPAALRPRRELPVKVIPAPKLDPIVVPSVDPFTKEADKIEDPERQKAELDQKTP